MGRGGGEQKEKTKKTAGMVSGHSPAHTMDVACFSWVNNVFLVSFCDSLVFCCYRVFVGGGCCFVFLFLFQKTFDYMLFHE